jgi:hypothetical protein
MLGSHRKPLPRLLVAPHARLRRHGQRLVARAREILALAAELQMSATGCVYEEEQLFHTAGICQSEFGCLESLRRHPRESGG